MAAIQPESTIHNDEEGLEFVINLNDKLNPMPINNS